MTAPTPTIIAGRYELQRRLAQGGMAEVWLANDLTLDRRVAVKWLKPTLATDEVVAERFRREAKAAASLDHANIVAVYDVFEHDGRQAVVMQLIDGKSLRQLLDTQKRLSPELTCHIGSAVAAALDHAHEAGFVHRDVKPGNIMITPDGRVLLTDFGIAKGLHGDTADDLTHDNIMMGTAKYLSPEQVRGKHLDGRADLYSLGLVLYECLAGRVPFLGETDADTALARLQRDPTDLARLRATLPTRLVSTIHDLLARNPDHRPATGSDLIVELKAAATEGAPEVDPTAAERSPVAPFSAGRLMRAPSDLRGRARDRDRASRTPPRGKQGRDAPSRPTRRPGDRRVRGDTAASRATPPGGPSANAGAPIDPMLSGPVAIPGEPAHITAGMPLTPPATPTAQSVRDASGERPSAAAVPPRDATPPAGHTLRGAPARGMGHSWNPSLTVVGGLIAIAVVVAIVLWMALEFGGGDSITSTTVLPGGDAAESAVLDETPPAEETPDADSGATNAATGDASAGGAATDAESASESADAGDPPTGAGGDGTVAQIASIATFDPVGATGDGEENAELVGAATDDDPTSSWRTECYSDRFMGAKDGVGLVLGFDATGLGPLQVDVASGPYSIVFLSSDADAAPTTIDGWTQFDKQFGDDPATITSPPPPASARHVLVLVEQLGPDADCSDANPYRARIADVRLIT